MSEKKKKRKKSKKDIGDIGKDYEKKYGFHDPENKRAAGPEEKPRHDLQTRARHCNREHSAGGRENCRVTRGPRNPRRICRTMRKGWS